MSESCGGSGTSNMRESCGGGGTNKSIIILKWPRKSKPQTNADRIRSMSDDELAILLDQTALNAYEYGTGMRENIKNASVSDWLDWLRQEVGE